MTRARAGDVALSARCLTAALGLKADSPEAVAGTRILAHLADDIRALRTAYVKSE